LQHLFKIFRFGLWGLPGFILAILLNYLFVDIFEYNIYASYIIILLLISALNFFIVDGIIFKIKGQEKKNSPDKRIIGFLMVTLSSRGAEWLAYSLLILYTDFYYLFVQVGVNIFFLSIKYLLLSRIMR